MNEFEKKLSEKLDSGREYRRMPAFSVRSSEDDKKIVDGYATTFNEPYLLYDWGDYKVYEQVDARAFDGCDMGDVIFQYDHNGRVFARTSNKTLELAADDHGLHVCADLSGTEQGRQLYEEISGGYTTKMSFGFRVGEDKREIVEDHENNVTSVYRTITKITKLYDVSAVSLPANDATEISARSISEGVVEDAKKEVLAIVERAKKIKTLKLMMEVS